MTRRTPIVGDRRGSEAPTGFAFFGRAAIGVLAAVTVVACGQGAPSAATNSATATPSATSAATPSATSAAPLLTPVASPPPGGPAPSQLVGSWYQVASPTTVLTLTATRYILRDTAEQGNGAIVVDANEIDFFSGTLCPLLLPQGVGRYRWTLQGDQLHLAPLSTDPCGRSDLLANQSYTKRVG